MHIGLIGGIGPAATDHYYRGLIQASTERGQDLDLTIAHADAATLLKNLAANDQAAQVEIFSELSGRLKRAGAKALAVTSIAGHFCIRELKQQSALPVIDLIEEVAQALTNGDIEKVGLIGTRTVMETYFYRGLGTTEIVLPSADERDRVHQSYVDMAVSCEVNEAQREVFFSAGRRLCDEQGAQAVMLGGTDLFLAFDGIDCGFDLIDCARIHVAAIARDAAGEQ